MIRSAFFSATVACLVFGCALCSFAGDLSRNNAQNLLMMKFERDLTFKLSGIREVAPDTFETVVVPESVRADHLRHAACLRNLSLQGFIEATVVPAPPHEWGPEKKYTFSLSEAFKSYIISRDYSDATFSFVLKVGELSGIKIKGIARVDENVRIVKYYPVYRLNILAEPLQVRNETDESSAVFQLYDDGWRVERIR